MADKKLVATIVSSREKGLERRNEMTTTTKKNNKKTNRIHFSFNSKDSKEVFFTGSEEDTKSKNTHRAAACEESKSRREKEKTEAVQDKETDTLEANVGSSSSKNTPLTQKEEIQAKTTFIVQQKNTRSMNSSERLEELFNEVHRVRWDVILISETWRQGKEVWETQQGHIVVELGLFNNKHGVAILLNRRWKNQINWVQCACERVVAASISVNKQPIILVSVYMPHSGYPDHHVEKTYKTITTAIEKDKSMKIIGGDLNAELCPGEGVELSSVGHYTLNKSNGRGEWMTQWLLENNLVELNTMYNKSPQKQVTYLTQRGAKKQLDYIMTDRKHLCWSKDAEANETMDMGCDHRCVMAVRNFKSKKETSSQQGAPDRL